MSFAKTVKNELATIPATHAEMLAEFSAFLNFSCDFHIEEGIKMIDYQTKNPTVAKRFLLLSKTLYQSDTELMTKEQQKFTKKPLVILRLITNVDKIIVEHNYLFDPINKMRDFTKTKEGKIAFLRGAFLVSGSVNHPKTAEYHLEIFVHKKEEVIFLQSVMNYFSFNARITKRRSGFIVYLKDAETISDFIQLVGANNAMFQFEDIRIKRDFNNSINRIINIELANEKKSLLTSVDQINDIELIMEHSYYLDIDIKLDKVMKLRIKYPDASLSELVTHYEEEYNETISKSGINHRFIKIKQLANSLRGSE